MNGELETYKHIKRVNELLIKASKILLDRAIRHDASKLQEPEKSGFEVAADLKNVTYGSDEYATMLKKLEPILIHHYANNSHHPQYYLDQGIDGMDLFDVLEMFCDWYAAGERHKDGSMTKSIEINKTRFNMSDQLVSIFKNTLEKYF